MLKVTSYILLICLAIISHAQLNQTYQSNNGSSHLIGTVTPEFLQTDAKCRSWFASHADSYSPILPEKSWSKKLKDTQVTIYFGSWCGDSKYWLPRFIKLWDELGLKNDQLKLVALYGSQASGGYKQGPHGEEKGRYIHRVPTFIFEREKKEIGRIVEHPVNDLVTDVAQIAVGYPSQASYPAANLLMELLSNRSMVEMNHEKANYLQVVKRIANQPYELNTLGYVLSNTGKLEEAAYVFDLNREAFSWSPNTHDSYAEILDKMGKPELAVANYQKVLLLDPQNENAKFQIAKINKKINGMPLN